MFTADVAWHRTLHKFGTNRRIAHPRALHHIDVLDVQLFTFKTALLIRDRQKPPPPLINGQQPRI
jgi:hypothetical protein